MRYEVNDKNDPDEALEFVPHTPTVRPRAPGVFTQDNTPRDPQPGDLMVTFEDDNKSAAQLSIFLVPDQLVDDKGAPIPSFAQGTGVWAPLIGGDTGAGQPEILVWQPSTAYFGGQMVMVENGNEWFLWRASQDIAPSNNAPGTAGAAPDWESVGGRAGQFTLLAPVANPAALPTIGNNNNDARIDQSTGHLWLWDGSNWQDMGDLRGVQGTVGPPGPQGPQGSGLHFLSAVAAVSDLPTTGNSNGDVHLVHGNGDLMFYVGPGNGTSGPPGHTDEWKDVGHVAGPPGPTGPDGPQGPPGTQPAGSVIAFAGDTAPTGYLLCNGGLASKTTYADLYAVIGDKYGTGDATRFRLPDLQGRSPIGVESSRTAIDALGKTTGTPDIILPRHRHDRGGLQVESHVHSIEHNHAQANTKVESRGHRHNTNPASRNVGGGKGSPGNPHSWPQDSASGVLFGPSANLNYIIGGTVQLYSHSPPDWFNKQLSVDIPSTQSSDETQNHTHPFDMPNFVDNSGPSTPRVLGSTGYDGTGTGAGGNFHPVLALNYIIKT